MEKQKCKECGLATHALLCSLRSPPASVTELRAKLADITALDARLQFHHDAASSLGKQWSAEQMALYYSVRRANKRTIAILHDVLKVRDVFKSEGSINAPR